MSSDPAVIDVTDATFDRDVIAASHERPVVVDFWAGWCAPCRALGPIIEQAVIEHGGVTLAKLDTDANPQSAQAFGIQGIPAVKGFRDGVVAAEFVGLQPRRAVEEFLLRLAPRTPRDLPDDEAGLRAWLAEHPDDSVADGRLARLEMLAAGETPPEDLDGVIDAVRSATGDERSRLRRIAVGMIAAMSGADPAAESMRSRLASALF